MMSFSNRCFPTKGTHSPACGLTCPRVERPLAPLPNDAVVYCHRLAMLARAMSDITDTIDAARFCCPYTVSPSHFSLDCNR